MAASVKGFWRIIPAAKEANPAGQQGYKHMVQRKTCRIILAAKEANPAGAQTYGTDKNMQNYTCCSATTFGWTLATGKLCKDS